jgi:hypothetical protein
MEYKGNNNQCDICANRYPCLHCGSRGKEGMRMLDNNLFSALYGKTIIKKVLLKNSGEVITTELSKADVKDLGWSMFIPLNRILDFEEKLFGITDMPIKKMFVKDVFKMERTKTHLSEQGISQIFVGWLNENEESRTSVGASTSDR